jgi:hypothetical protein
MMISRSPKTLAQRAWQADAPLAPYLVRECYGSFQLGLGVQRYEAHRFHFREGMKISSYRLSKSFRGDTDEEL